MTLKILKPAYVRHSSDYQGDKVRVGFPVIQDAQQLIIFIGKDVGNKFGIKAGEQYSVGVYPDEAFKIRLIKDPEGYTVGKQGTNLKLQLRWHEKVPEGYDKRMRYATTNMVEGYLELSLPRANKQSMQE